MTTALAIIAIAGWVLAAFGWIAAWGTDDLLAEARNDLRDQVYRRCDAEEALKLGGRS